MCRTHTSRKTVSLSSSWLDVSSWIGARAALSESLSCWPNSVWMLRGNEGIPWPILVLKCCMIDNVCNFFFDSKEVVISKLEEETGINRTYCFHWWTQLYCMQENPKHCLLSRCCMPRECGMWNVMSDVTFFGGMVWGDVFFLICVDCIPQRQHFRLSSFKPAEQEGLGCRL